MPERISSSRLAFSEQAIGTSDRVALVFKEWTDLDTVPEQVVMIGQSISSLVSALPDGDFKAAVHEIIPTDPQAKGCTVSSFTKVNGRKTKIQIFMTPTEASRHNCSFRPDTISKSMLSAFPDLVSEASKSSTNRIAVVCAVPSAEAVPSVGFAIARSLPRFTRKTERGRDLDTSKPQVTIEVSFFIASGEKISAETITSLSTISESIRMSQTLTDTPPNELNVTSYVDFVKKVVSALPVEVKVIQGTELEEKGFGGIWNVGKGQTTNPPALVILTLKGSSDKSVVLVGKGIVYDSGGLAIKPRDGMCNMKSDMSGSAAMFSSFVAIARLGGLKTGETLHCILCLAENSIGPDSFRNDDILKMYSDMTVEVNNTDAEGRLVLADGCTYAAKHLNPRLVVDMATLTGAQGIATGQYHAAALCANDAEEIEVVKAGKKSGDLTFPIVYCPEFHRLNYKSEVADMKNSVSNRMDATSSASGWFIYDHMNAAGYTGPWIHVDMASPATFGSTGAGTGYGVGLICTLLQAI
jgi:probable aminopeptidase NPEPL1